MKEWSSADGCEQTEIAACPGVKNCLSVVTFQVVIKASCLKTIWRKLRANFSQQSGERK